jgi:hypothetical protein
LHLITLFMKILNDCVWFSDYDFITSWSSVLQGFC